MQSAIEITISKILPKTLVMSPPMWGKTAFAGTWPGNSYFFDFDGNMDTLYGKEGVYWDTYKDHDPKKPMALQNAIRTFTEMTKVPGKVMLEGVEFNHIVIDSATSLIEVCMNYHLFIAGRVGEMPQVGTSTTNDYSGANYYFKQFLQRVLALPIAVTLNCHEEIDANETIGERNEKGGIKRVYPALIGKFSTQASSKFGLALRMTVGRNPETKEEVRRLLTKPEGVYYAGHRYADALDTYEVPDWNVILKKIETHLTKLKTNKETK